MAEASDKKEDTSKPSTSGRKGGRNTSGSKIDFVPGTLLEARDFANNWFPSKVVEVDVEGREVLVHFLNWSSRYDEWISMDSARLRPVSNNTDKLSPAKGSRSKDFKVGEKVMAVWHNSKRYPARITKVLDQGNYEVIFYDGFSMQVKGKQMSRIPKEQAEKMEIPFTNTQEAEKVADAEEIGSKEERRKRKKKIEVAELFRCYKKRPSTETNKDGASTSESVAKEDNDSLGESITPSVTPVPGEKKKTKVKRERTLTKDHGDTINLKDDSLPEGWEKKAKFKTSGTKSGKWDVVIIGPDGRTFRSKQEIKQYMFIRQLDHDIELFNFRLGEDFYTSRGLEVPVRARAANKPPSAQIKKSEPERAPTPGPSATASTEAPATPIAATHEVLTTEKLQPLKTNLKSEPTTPLVAEPETPTFIPEEDGYRCPVEDCRKLFRRDNLLGMHIKHYHPALYKKLGCKFLRVEELASARTAFETEEPRSSPVAPAHPVLASILTNPSQPSPSPPPPRARLSSERKTDRERDRFVDSPASDELQSLPLSKRLNMNESQSKASPIATGTTKAARRKSEKKHMDIPAVEETHHHECSEGEGETDLEPKLPGADELSLKEEPYVSMLDDIPGQKELVHCFCGSPEEDGLMIQCELCLCWQHGICLQIDSEEKVPDPYVCHFCRFPSRERVSRRYTHDQTWLKKGQLPSLKFISGGSTVPADRALRVAHTLTAAATDLKQLLHSLKVKIDVAKNKDHPKLYLWAQPWNKKAEVESANNLTGQQASLEEMKTLVPNIPLPETPIDATDCRLNLLLHIADMQNEVGSRLEHLERLFEECESDEGLMDTSHVAKMLQILLKDVITLKKMASFSWSS